MSNASTKNGETEEKRKKLLLVINSVRVQDDLKLLGMKVIQQVQTISTVCKMMARHEVSFKTSERL